MGRIRYTEKLLSIIFLALGFSFVIMGILCYIGIIKPSTHSRVQDSIQLGIIFACFGICFLIVYIVCWMIGVAKDKERTELLNNGIMITGTVEKVYMQSLIQYGNISPYRVCYTYSYRGKEYYHKSHLLWEIPNYVKNDKIAVYVNEDGKSAIQ